MSNRYDIWMNDHFLSIQEESDYDFFIQALKGYRNMGPTRTQGGDGVVTCELTANQSVQILSQLPWQRTITATAEM